ncbi:chaperonin 10-like protein [Zopfochytrium polystomum]|nr:chaperonin 10-like protein [Zopfochytrium polystomum]
MAAPDLTPSNDEYHGLAAFEPGITLKPHTYKAKKFEDYDVEIKITHCGVCGSDIHTITGGWGSINYPQVVGHEIVGHVTRIGSAVDPKKYAIGTRVGVGAQCRTCMTCKDCKAGKEHCCRKGIDTYTGKYEDGYISQGGYADYFRCHYNWVVPIPDGLPSEIAAPMLCAGITTYQPLKKYGVGPGKRVGVIGLGGLGHLGIMWAVKLGADVTAISSSSRKKSDALNLFGAHHYLDTSNPAELAAHDAAFDVVLCTAFGNDTDWDLLLKMVDSDGVFVLVGLPEKPISIKPFSLCVPQVAVVGSHIGSPAMIAEMLQFAVDHGVKTVVEVKPMEKAAEALHQLHTTGAKYRLVLQR